MLLIAIAGCSNAVSDSIQDLQAARTADQEQQAFDQLWQHSDHLAFTPLDASGEPIPFDHQWPKHVVSIDLVVDDVSFRHHVIHTDNLWYLMRE